MACNATRIELSNSAVTTLTVTLTSDPGDSTTVLLIVDGLGITTSGTTSGGSATLTPVAAVTADTNSLWDAVIQVGTNRPAVAEVLITETNTAQSLGITITDSQVTYCAPTGGGGVSDHGALTGLGDNDHPQYMLKSSAMPPNIKTIGMGRGGYASYTAESYASATICTIGDSYYTAASLSKPTEVSSSAVATSWANFISAVVLETLTAADHIDGQPILIDPEDLGVDGALYLQDWQKALSAKSSTSITPNAPYDDASISYTGSEFPGGTDWSVAYPLILDAMEQVTTAVRAVWPNSPIGWYNGGPGVYFPGWVASIRKPYDGSNMYEAAEEYYSKIAAQDANYTTWRLIEEHGVDWAWLPMYQSSDGGVTKSWFSGVAAEDRQRIWWHLILKYFGPSTASWPDYASKLFFAVTPNWISSGGTDYNYSAKEWFASDVQDQAAVVCPNWDDAGTQLHPDFSALMSQFFGAPSLLDINDPMRSIDESQDYLAWLFAENEDEKPSGYQVLPHRNEFDAEELPDRVRDLNLAIWDEFFKSPRYYSLADAAPVYQFRDKIAFGDFDGATPLNDTDKERYQRIFAANDVYEQVNLYFSTEPWSEGVAAILDWRALRLAEIFTTRTASFFNYSSNTLDSLFDVDAPTPADGEVLTWNATSGFWEPTANGSGTVTSVGLTVPGGFTVGGTNPITASGTFEITSSLSGIIKGDGAAVFSGNAELNDLADVNVAQGAGNDGDLITYDHAAGAGAKFKGVARSSIGLSEFNDDLPAVKDSYLMLIESPSVKAYTLDGSVTADRTITAIYAKLGGGTSATVDFKRTRSGTTVDIASGVSVTTTAATPSLSNTGLEDGDRLWINVSAISAPEDMEIVVEYTQ